MKSHTIWMPVYIGDYLADTQHLSKAEHGSYFLAMMAYYRKAGPLTTKELYGICGKEVDVISAFFTNEDGIWRHKKIDQELAKAESRLKIAQEKGRKGAAARIANLKLPTRR